MQIGCTRSTKVAGGLLASRTFIDAYLLSGARRDRQKGRFSLRPSFVIREIRDTRLLSVKCGGSMANGVQHAPPSNPCVQTPNIFRNPAEDCVARTEIFRAINFTSICKNPRRGPTQSGRVSIIEIHVKLMDVYRNVYCNICYICVVPSVLRIARFI